eukprot:2427441-Ditylum_brightwellii.AAC.1
MDNRLPFPPVYVDFLEGYEHVPIIPEEILCRYNQVQQDKAQNEGWISDHPSKGVCNCIEIYNFGAILEKVIEEHHDQLKLPKGVVSHVNKFI